MVDTSGKRWPIIQDILRKEGIAKKFTTYPEDELV